MKVIAYLRVSTEQQAESGLGLEAQKSACESYAKKIGKEVEKEFRDEGLSGSLSLEKRPGMLHAIAELKKGDILLIAKRDRLGRDPLVVAMIESAIARKGARIVSAAGEGTESDDPSSILMRRMIDAFGEYERLIIKARTKAAMQAKKRRGERVGHIPFGYRLTENGMHIERDIEEQKVLEKLKMFRRVGKSIRAIAKEMNSNGDWNRRQSPWNHASVHRILTSPNF